METNMNTIPFDLMDQQDESKVTILHSDVLTIITSILAKNLPPPLVMDDDDKDEPRGIEISGKLEALKQHIWQYFITLDAPFYLNILRMIQDCFQNRLTQKALKSLFYEIYRLLHLHLKSWNHRDVTRIIGLYFLGIMDLVTYYQGITLEYLQEDLSDLRWGVNIDDLNQLQTNGYYYLSFFIRTFLCIDFPFYNIADVENILMFMIHNFYFQWNPHTFHREIVLLTTGTFPLFVKHEINSIDFFRNRNRSIAKRLRELMSNHHEVNEIEFIRVLGQLFPELQYYQYLCDVTPDVITGQAHQINRSLVDALFEPTIATHMPVEMIIEINKFLTRLIYLRDVIAGEKTRFPYLSPQNFENFRQFILNSTQTDEELQFLFLSLIWDDLGRTQPIRNKVYDYEKLVRSRDHDELLKLFFQYYRQPEYLKEFHELLPSFQLLSFNEQRLYLNQISNTFNLGAFVQGESVPYSLYQFYRSCRTIVEQRCRLLVQILSFSAVNHAADDFHSVLFNDTHYHQFMLATDVILNHSSGHSSLLSDHSCQVYETYLRQRAEMIIPHFLSTIELPDREQYALFRIISLARASKQAQWEEIWDVWKSLPHDTRCLLTNSLNCTGFSSQETAIYIYYAPAIIANSIDYFRRNEHSAPFAKGLSYGLREIASIYLQMEQDLRQGRVQPSERIGRFGGVYIYYAQLNAERMKNLE